MLIFRAVWGASLGYENMMCVSLLKAVSWPERNHVHHITLDQKQTTLPQKIIDRHLP